MEEEKKEIRISFNTALNWILIVVLSVVIVFMLYLIIALFI